MTTTASRLPCCQPRRVQNRTCAFAAVLVIGGVVIDYDGLPPLLRGPRLGAAAAALRRRLRGGLRRRLRGGLRCRLRGGLRPGRPPAPRRCSPIRRRRCSFTCMASTVVNGSEACGALLCACESPQRDARTTRVPRPCASASLDQHLGTTVWQHLGLAPERWLSAAPPACPAGPRWGCPPLCPPSASPQTAPGSSKNAVRATHGPPQSINARTATKYRCPSNPALTTLSKMSSHRTSFVPNLSSRYLAFGNSSVPIIFRRPSGKSMYSTGFFESSCASVPCMTDA